MSVANESDLFDCKDFLRRFIASFVAEVRCKNLINAKEKTAISWFFFFFSVVQRSCRFCDQILIACV